MLGNSLTSKQIVAFKIGARARKFAVEGCAIEGYDYLYGCIADAQVRDPDLHTLLQTELTKFEQRVAELDDQI